MYYINKMNSTNPVTPQIRTHTQRQRQQTRQDLAQILYNQLEQLEQLKGE